MLRTEVQCPEIGDIKDCSQALLHILFISRWPGHFLAVLGLSYRVYDLGKVSSQILDTLSQKCLIYKCAELCWQICVGGPLYPSCSV